MTIAPDCKGFEMFAKGDIVRDTGQNGVRGRVVFVFDEMHDGVSEQVVTLQPMGTDDALLRVTRLASELTFESNLSQDSEKGWTLS